jgi:hypothetical protein
MSGTLSSQDPIVEARAYEEMNRQVDRFHRGLEVRASLNVLDFAKVAEHDSMLIRAAVMGRLKEGDADLVALMAAIGITTKNSKTEDLIIAVSGMSSSELEEIVTKYLWQDEDLHRLVVNFFRILRTTAFRGACRRAKRNIDIRSQLGFSHLALSARQGDFVSVYMLLRDGADARSRSQDGKTVAELMMEVCNAQCRTFGLACVHEPVMELLCAASNTNNNET